MNKTKRIIAIVFISLLLLSIAPISVWAKNHKNQAVLPEKESITSVQVSSEKEKSSIEIAKEKIDSSMVMKVLSLSSSNMESFDTADYESNIKYTAKFDDGSAVDFDKDINLISYSNFDRKTENSQTSNEKIINALKQEYNIDETYQMDTVYEANENGKDDTKYYWSKTEENGVQNFYDALSVRIDGSTNEIVTFNRFNDVAKPSEIKITEEEAKQIALRFKEEFTSVKSIEKAYVMPNDFWNEEGADESEHTVRLAYIVHLNENRFLVYVDAETGKVLGGDMAKCISE